MSIASARRTVEWILDDRRHYCDVTPDGNWVLMHPLSCRMAEGSLLACRITEVVGRGWRPDEGRYLIEPCVREYVDGYPEGANVFTDLMWTPVKKDFDPIVSRLHLILEHLNHADNLDCSRDHDLLCCPDHKTHANPHVGCILR